MMPISIFRPIAAITLILSLVSLTTANEASLFEQLNPQAEQQRVVKKYAQDKERLSYALQNTKDLIRKSQGKAYLPELYLRLAELYIQKSRAAYMEVRMLSGPEASDISALESRNLKLQAIEIYQRILNVYPKFGERDKVHFYLAHEFKELGRNDEMLREYSLLIKQYPNSDFAPEALLLTGDHYFGLSKTEDSRRYYERVLKYKGHSAAVVARYKLAWVHINLKKFDKAVALLIASIEDANTQKKIDVDTYEGLDIRLESLIDLAFIYPDHFKKAKATHAVELFRDLSWSRTAYLSVLEKVGSRLRVRKHWPRALEVYRELIKLENDPAALVDHAHYLFESYQQVKDNKLKAMPGSASDIQMLVRALRLQSSTVYIEDKDKQEAETSIEAYTRDIATTIHKRAKKSKKSADFANAASAYEAYLAWFDQGKNSLQMRLNLADSLYNSGDFFGAALAYEKASQDKRLKKTDLATTLYSSLHAYQVALKSPEPMNHLHTLQARSGLVATGERHLAQFPNTKHSTEVEFNIAWIRYDEGKFELAIEGFSKFLQRHPRGEMASAAVELVIDSYQVIEDWSGLYKFTQMALAIPGLPKKDKMELARLSGAAQEKIVSSLTIAALDDWEQGAQNMLDYASDHPSASLGIQALGSLMALSQEKNDLRTLQVATAELTQKAPRTEAAQNGIKMMIDASLKAGHYRLLQTNLQQYAELFPNDPDSREFSLQSARIQQQLGQSKEAVASYQSYLNRYSPKGAELASVIQGMAESNLNLGQEKVALKSLLAARKKIPSSQRKDVDALAGLLLIERGDIKTAGLVSTSLAKGKATGNATTDRRIAQLLFSQTDGGLNGYRKLTLKKGIDAAVVQSKTDSLQRLGESYQRVLNYKVPKWSAAAMFRLAFINEDYANFLLEAPVPSELSKADQAQYVELIAQQAQPYQQEAAQYLKAGRDLVQRLGLLDASLQNYKGGAVAFGTELPVNSYSKGKAVNTKKSLADDELYNLHQQLVMNGSNETALLELSQQYFERGDLTQALMLATQHGEKINDGARSKLLNLAGVVHFAQGNIDSAQSLFTNATELAPNNFNALANLASLYADHGAKSKAYDNFSRLPPDWRVPEFDHQRISLVKKYFKDFRKEVKQQ